MKNLLLFTILSIVFMISSCDKNEPQVEPASDIELNFNANYEGELLLLEKEYNYEGDIPIKFAQFNFYIANVALIKQNGGEIEETELLEIDFVDFPHNFNEAAEAEKGQTVRINEIPVGEYDGIRIGFGVPADLNRTKPNDYSSESVMSKSSHYWDGWSSYIFSKIEGKADIDKDGAFETNDGEGLAYHMGTDDVYTTRTIFENLTLTENQTLNLQLNINLKDLFKMSNPDFDANGDGYLDIENYESVHGQDRLEVAKKMMNNFSEATTLDQ